MTILCWGPVLVMVVCFCLVAPVMLSWSRVPAETIALVVVPGVAGTTRFIDDDCPPRCRGPPNPQGRPVMALRLTLPCPQTPPCPLMATRWAAPSGPAPA